jgi:hypothetical protein
MKITLITLFFITSIKCFTQEFGTLNSEWIYDYNGFWSHGVTRIKFDKDTLLGGELTQVYSKKAIRASRQSSDTSQYDLEPLYIRSYDGVILISEKGEVYDTLINYKAEIGRSWNIYKRDNNNSISASIKITILDTFRTNFSGINIFTQAARYTWPQFTDYVDTVYEYIGSRLHYIIPFDEIAVAVDGGEGGEIRCYKNDLLNLISFNNLRSGNNFRYDCNIITSSKNISNTSNITGLNYRYQSSILRIENLSDLAYKLNLVDILGRLILTDNLTYGTNNINIANLPAGVYFLIANGSFIGKFAN